MKIPNFFLLFSFLFLTSGAFAQGPMVILNQEFGDAPVGSEVVIRLTTQNFVDIFTLQTGFQYNVDVLELTDISGNPELPDIESSINSFPPNNILISWFDPTTNGLSLPDGSEFIEFTFIRIAVGLPNFIISEDFIITEVTNPSGLGTLEMGETFGLKEIAGYVFFDANVDCIRQEEEIPMSLAKVKLQNADYDLEIFTNTDGYYRATLTEGEYSVQAFQNGIWTSCPSLLVTAADYGEVTTNLGLQTTASCETMQVNIATPLIIRCFDANYYVSYVNNGSINIENATIEVELDPDLNYSSSSIVPVSIDENLLTFELGNLNIGQGGSFTLATEVGCEDVYLGQTHCTTATAFPQDDCQETEPIWDGSSLSVTGECVDNEVTFTVSNIGIDMTNSSELVIMKDAIILEQESILLTANETTTFSFISDGSTFHANVQQTIGHPGVSSPALAIEGCGTNDAGEISTGFVNMFPEDDGDGFISISCVENVGSYDPNDKSASPRGALEANYIEQNVDLEYLIRFQNTGTFTAFNVELIDELSEHLDPTRIQLGASSHDYTLNIREGNILEFNFENIMLPDSATDLTGSNGFVQFRIPQQVDVPLETVIENTAAIYFDFNEAVITNTVFHTVGKDFLEVVLDVENDISEQIKLKVAPNPVSETAVFELGDYQAQNGHFVLTDVTGKLVSQNKFVGNTFTFERNALSAGIYFFEIMDEDLILKSGKLVIN